MSQPSGAVLLIEPAITVRQFIKSELRALGINVVYEAETAEEALHILRAFMANPPALAIQLVIAELSLAQMSGLELGKSIRMSLGLNKVPFLLLVQDSERFKLMEAIPAGIQHTLLKPFTQEQFQEKLRSLWKFKQETSL